MRTRDPPNTFHNRAWALIWKREPNKVLLIQSPASFLNTILVNSYLTIRSSIFGQSPGIFYLQSHTLLFPTATQQRTYRSKNIWQYTTHPKYQVDKQHKVLQKRVTPRQTHSFSPLRANSERSPKNSPSPSSHTIQTHTDVSTLTTAPSPSVAQLPLVSRTDHLV
jgi:hypothetical protein